LSIEKRDMSSAARASPPVGETVLHGISFPDDHRKPAARTMGILPPAHIASINIFQNPRCFTEHFIHKAQACGRLLPFPGGVISGEVDRDFDGEFFCYPADKGADRFSIVIDSCHNEISEFKMDPGLIDGAGIVQYHRKRSSGKTAVDIFIKGFDIEIDSFYPGKKLFQGLRIYKAVGHQYYIRALAFPQRRRREIKDIFKPHERLCISESDLSGPPFFHQMGQVFWREVLSPGPLLGNGPILTPGAMQIAAK